MDKTNPKMIPIVIPSYEPDEKLIKLLETLKENGFQKLLLVDDGSGEDYQTYFLRAKELGAVVLRHEINKGKGRALKTAFSYLLEKEKDLIGCITADSDGQHTPEAILKCSEALLQYEKALIMGCRSFDEEGVPARSEFGNKCTRVVMKYLAGVAVSDTQTGLRGISASFMKELLSVKGERFEFETNMLMETKKLRIPIVEIPIETIYIDENKTSHFHPIRDSFKIYMLFGKFLFSSLSSSVLDLVLFSAFCALLKNRDLAFLHMTYLTLATVLARVLSAAYNYSMNFKVVFDSRSSIASSMTKYIALAIVQMACSALLVNLLYPLFGGAEVLVKMPVDIALFFISFVIQREFVYR